MWSYPWISYSSFLISPNFSYNFWYIWYFTDDFAIIHGYDTGVYLPFTRNFFIDISGVFHNNVTSISYPPEEEVYCIEHATKDNYDLGYELFRMFPKSKQEKPMDLKFHFNRYAMIISGIFLILTIMYYVLKKEVRKMFGKVLVSFCLSLVILYGVLVFFTYEGKLHYEKTRTICKAMGSYNFSLNIRQMYKTVNYSSELLNCMYPMA